MGRRPAKVNLPKKGHFRVTIEKTVTLHLTSVVELDIFLNGDETAISRARKLKRAVKEQLQRESRVGIEREWYTEKMSEKSEFEVKASSIGEDDAHITAIESLTDSR